MFVDFALPGNEETTQPHNSEEGEGEGHSPSGVDDVPQHEQQRGEPAVGHGQWLSAHSDIKTVLPSGALWKA